MKSRLFFLSVIFLVLIVAAVARLFQLQVLDHAIYQSLAANQHGLSRILVPVRGEILAHSGKSGDDDRVILVTNIQRDLVFAVPEEITDKKLTAIALAPVLGMKQAEVLEKVSRGHQYKWVPIKKELSESQSLAVKELKLPGIYLQAETYRFYPENELAAQVLGFLGFNGDLREGRYGVEQFYQNRLAGKAGKLELEKNAGGAWITRGARNLKPAEDGKNIVLTINQAIQFRAEEVLRSTVEKHQADGGSIVILDPRTGAVLAMANHPTFNPNQYAKTEDSGVYRNRAVSDAYEPGSVFKPLTLAAALNAGVITSDTTYEDTGILRYDKYVIRNSDSKAHGLQTMTEVLEKSLNTGAIFAQDRLGAEKFLAAVRAFGFGSLTGVSLPSESPGNIQNLVGGGDVHYATASFGQGITVTPLQLAQAFSAIANQGKMMRPYIVEGEGPKEAVQVISPASAATVGAMLVSVVENGHGKKAGVSGYYVAGKTGTAQVAEPGTPGYDLNKTNGTFVGFAPVDDPAFVMVVKIENPKGVRFAESTAAPAFGEMARFMLNYFRVPPSR